jgi:LPS export ABC transporter protein LptC
VDLHGDVKMEGQLSGSPVVINTSTIAFDTRTEIARTPAFYTVDARGGSLSATGLVANLKDGTLELESNPHVESPVHASPRRK